MRRTHVIAISLVSAVSAAGLTHALAGPNWTPPVLMAEAAHGNSHGWTSSHSVPHQRGWSHRPGGKGHGRFCSRIQEDGLDPALTAIEQAAGFTPPQNAAWSELKGEIRAAGASIEDACGEAADSESPAPAPHRLARLETLLTAGLAGLRRVRPAFERLYATLSKEQKATFNSLMTGKGHH